MDVAALQQRAKQVLDPTTYDYYAGGADDEQTLRANVSAWSEFDLYPRVLRDVSHVSTATSLLGVDVVSPILVAPTAYHRLAHPEGEAATARGAADVGALMVVSTLATTSLEDVASAAPEAPRWFQLYVHKDREFTKELVARAVGAGYGALVLTVDLPVLGRRRRDEVNNFTLPDGLEMANVGKPVPSVDGSGLDAYADVSLDPTLTFATIGWLQSFTDLPILVKGVVRSDDAVVAVQSGAAGIVVSNHGGRQLDGCVPTARALRPVVDAVASEVPVLVDGGIRSGTDVMRALALGASAVLVGRPILWGLAIGGAEGVASVLLELTQELETAMALCGVTTVSDIDRTLLATR